MYLYARYVCIIAQLSDDVSSGPCVSCLAVYITATKWNADDDIFWRTLFVLSSTKKNWGTCKRGSGLCAERRSWKYRKKNWGRCERGSGLCAELKSSSFFFYYQVSITSREVKQWQNRETTPPYVYVPQKIYPLHRLIMVIMTKAALQKRPCGFSCVCFLHIVWYCIFQTKWKTNKQREHSYGVT